MKIITSSFDETFAFGKEFASNLKRGTIITLDGDLGAGKTALTSGIVAGLGSADIVTSPTFTIVNEYRKGEVPVFHFDLYRLSCMDDLYDIGWEDYVNQDAIIIIEWADIVKKEFDYPYVEIVIKKLNDVIQTTGGSCRKTSKRYRSNAPASRCTSAEEEYRNEPYPEDGEPYGYPR